MMNDNFLNDPTVRLSESYRQQRDEINRMYRGTERKARLMIADLTYGLGLMESNLGAESVRDNWRKHIERMWRSTRTEETTVREHLLMTIDWAAHSYVQPWPAGHWKNPRSSERTHFVTDANGVEHHLMMELPSANEAAAEGVAFLARFDPELAGRIGIADITPLIEVWLDRKKNVGRRGKTQRIDEALCALVQKLGYGKVESDAMRRQRLAFEKNYPTTPRASHAA